MSTLPRAILFDLDDTIVSAYRNPELAWRSVVLELSELIGPRAPEEVVQTILANAREVWSDAGQQEHWRMRPDEARRQIVRAAFAALDSEEHRLSPEAADRIAERFTRLRDDQMGLFPDARDTLDALRQRGVALALVTNGPSELQRGNIAHFDLERRFDHVQIEQEQGFGKPEERAYLHAMQALSTTATETWMVGDDLEWEVAAPQRLGIWSIWYDPDSRGLPRGSSVRPDRTIRALSELLPP